MLSRELFRSSSPVFAYAGWMSWMSAAAMPVEVEQPRTDEVVRPATPWVTIVWNDPVNLMSYVTYVFQEYFGYSKEVATSLMLDVHEKGRAVVSNGSLEEMERDVHALHGYGLWATFSNDGAGGKDGSP